MEIKKNGMKFKKVTFNVPLDLYEDLSSEAKVMGVNITSMLLMKLNQIKEQQNALLTLNKAIDAINYQEKYKFIKTKNDK